MSTRGSKVLVLLAALLVLAIGFFVWRASSGSSDVAGVAPSANNTEQPQAVDSAPPAVVEMPQTAYAGGVQPPVAAKDAQRVALEKSAEPKDPDALWISGRLIYPARTPLGETVEVVAKNKGLRSPRARVEAGGDFRIALAPKSRSAIFDIEAQHLFLREPLTIKIKDGNPAREVVLEPVLGGCFAVQLHVPPQAASLAPKLVGNSVASFGMSNAAAYPSSNRMAVFSKDLRAQLRGLDAKLVYAVIFDSTFFAKATLDGLQVEPGETRQLNLDLLLGVELRGRLIIPGEGNRHDLLLRVESTSKQAAQSGVDAPEQTSFKYADVDQDGSFVARGVTPGRITLRATANQRTPAELDLGSLADGDVREGIELAMGLGGQIGGHVSWQDGSPAVGAVVQLLPEGKQAKRQNPFLDGTPKVFHEAIVDADGAFLISGLNEGPLTLVAQFTDYESAPKGVEAKPKGKAKIENVAIGTLDMKVVLQGGYSIKGSVVDDAGAPIQKFRVTATPEPADAASKPLIIPISNKLGRFELTGLLDGSYLVGISAARYENPDPLLVRVPVDTTPLTFVLARRASISGVVVQPDGSPAAQARLRIQPQDLQIWIPRDTVDGLSNSQGQFDLTSVGAGAIVLRAQSEKFASSEELPLQVSPGQRIEGLRLVLRTPARITGEVLPTHEGERISGRMIHGYSGQDSQISGLTDDKGRFEFEHVDPGEYTIVLQPSSEERERFQNPGAEPMPDHEVDFALTKIRELRVDEGGEAHVVFGPSNLATISVRGIVRRGETPWPSVHVRALLVDQKDPRGGPHAWTDESGRFELSVETPGRYRVQAMVNGVMGMPSGVQVDVPAGGADSIEIAIGNGRITGIAHAFGNQAPGEIAVWLERDDGERAGFTPDISTWPDLRIEFVNLPVGNYTLVASAWRVDSQDRPLAILAPTRQRIELRENQELDDVRIEVDGH
ncbi:MAG TPA: carboxypeptidase-like regulatory domain-containing protein [Planctomycetota bacterium]|nr:carboxypeptidase-like regulatory domain-containing protein [Planctomycetota bacterium]